MTEPFPEPPTTDQVTEVLAAPETVAVKDFDVPSGTVTGDGLTEMVTAGGATRITVDSP